MATTTANGFSFSGLFTGMGSSIYNALIRMGEARSRTDQMDTLNAKTDAELAEMGLRREDIARYVFRDMMHI